MRSMRFLVPAALASVSLAVLGCDPPESVDDVIDQRVAIPEPPANGLQVVGPDIEIPPGEDQMWCWVPEMPARDADVLVDRFETFQGGAGHHLLAMRSIIPRQPGEIFDCTSLDNMSTVRPLFTPNTSNSEGTFNLLTSDFAVRLPKDAQIVMQSHYVNVNLEPIVVRDVGHLLFLPDDEERIEANYFALHDGAFSVPPTNERYTHSTDCVLEEPMQFASIIGHMHEWGKRIVIEKIDGEGAIETIYEVAEWHAGLRDAPPVTHYPLDNALSLEAGDTLRLTCEWENDTDEALGFPNEMCDSMLVYYPARPEGFIICGE
jgi:hypothetical protein